MSEYVRTRWFHSRCYHSTQLILQSGNILLIPLALDMDMPVQWPHYPINYERLRNQTGHVCVWMSHITHVAKGWAHTINWMRAGTPRSGEDWPPPRTSPALVRAISCHSWLCLILVVSVQTLCVMQTMFPSNYDYINASIVLALLRRWLLPCPRQCLRIDYTFVVLPQKLFLIGPPPCCAANH